MSGSQCAFVLSRFLRVQCYCDASVVIQYVTHKQEVALTGLPTFIDTLGVLTGGTADVDGDMTGEAPAEEVATLSGAAAASAQAHGSTPLP